jgi:predicted house-cleaning noncanonical NTP pyrophosphatase (MazG superfamily)
VSVVKGQLVRDKIAEQAAAGVDYSFITANGSSLRGHLELTLRAEVAAFFETDDVLELVDIVEVVLALAKSKGISAEEFEQLRLSKLEVAGDYSGRKVWL